MSEADCRRRAEELEEVASRLGPSPQRDEYLMLARHWRELGTGTFISAQRGDNHGE